MRVGEVLRRLVMRVRKWIGGSAALALLVGCGSGEGAASKGLEIQRLNPSSIGARSPDFFLTIIGTGFASDSVVLLGNVEVGRVTESPAALFAQIPGGTAGTTVSGTLPVSVRDGTGKRSNELSLVVTEAPAPILTVLSSDLCTRDTGPIHVTLTGDNFTTDMTLESNGELVPIGVQSRTMSSFAVARGERHYSFKVTVPPPGGGEATTGLATFLDCD
jgi:hypothetical protein